MKYFDNSNKASHPYDGPSASQEQFRKQLSSWQAMIGAPDWNRQPLTADEYGYYEHRAKKIRSQTFSEIFRALVDRVHAHRQQRENIRELTALSDRELTDIGITRADVYGVASGVITVEEINQTRDAARHSTGSLIPDPEPKQAVALVAFPVANKRIPAVCDTEIVGHAA